VASQGVERGGRHGQRRRDLAVVRHRTWVVQGKKESLMGETHMAVTGERKGIMAEVHKLEGKAPCGKYAKALQAEWAEREVAACEARRGGTSELGRLGWIPGEDSNEN
jgi:hypothetical protein